MKKFLPWLTLCVLSAGDIISTKYALLHGAVEGNPAMALLISHGWTYAILFKVFSCLMCLFLVFYRYVYTLDLIVLVYALVVLRTVINLMQLG